MNTYNNYKYIQLKKEFTYGFNKKKKVVDDLSINFYENQITGLLGHNGAGKVNYLKRI